MKLRKITKKTVSIIIAFTFMLGFTDGLKLNAANNISDETNYSPTTKVLDDGSIVELNENDYNSSGYVITKQRSVDLSEGVVNFRTKSSNSNTTYVEDGTNKSGYTNGTYAADAAFLGYNSDKSKIKFMLSGVIGWVNSSEVQLLSYSDSAVQTLSKYEVSNGTIYHEISNNLNNSSYSSKINVGKIGLPDGLYYSYDGHYFYSYGRNGYRTMINDYKNNVRSNAVNANQPYYNYFQYLPHRSLTNYSGSQINEFIKLNTGSTSKLQGTGNAFIQSQNKYGSNALLMLGVAINESAWGNSNIAMKKNNLFGHGATDNNPFWGSNGYNDPGDSIMYHGGYFISRGYCYPRDWRYNGSHLGDKASGVNVQYASDPYWGEKAASYAWLFDNYYKNKDAMQYTIAIKDVYNNDHTNMNVINEPYSSQILYTTNTSQSKGQSASNYPFIILGNGIENNHYKVQSDSAIDASRQSIIKQTDYNFQNDYGYILNNSNIKIINDGSKQYSSVFSINNISLEASDNFQGFEGKEVTFKIHYSENIENLKYKLVWKKDNWSSWGIIKDLDNNNYCSWVPETAGTYEILVDVDKNGDTITKSFSYTAAEALKWSYESVDLSASSIDVNSSVKITANVIGEISGLRYKYVWQKNNWESWGVIADNSTSNSITWTPSSAGDYSIIVDVTDLNGYTFSKKTKICVKKSEMVYNGVKLSTSSTTAGTPVKITADVSGDTQGVKYKYVWQKNNWESWGVIADNSTGNSITWTPSSAGDYSIIVDVIPQNGRITTKSADLRVSKGEMVYNGVKLSTSSTTAGT
ncbi:glucosaminidase domain-containing protein, partial [Thomasclavelia ramosa]